MSSNELKRCPCCKSAAVYEEDPTAVLLSWRVKCSSRRCRLATCWWLKASSDEAKARAAVAWNRRADDERVARLEAALLHPGKVQDLLRWLDDEGWGVSYDSPEAREYLDAFAKHKGDAT